jgi:hypothetical protein
MKVLSNKRSSTFYVVTDLPWLGNGPRLSKCADVRLYEVSPSSPPLSDDQPVFRANVVGMLVGAKTKKEAEATVRDILRYSGIVP